MPVPAEEVERAFNALVKSLRCPHCDVEFSDYAVDWGWAWCEGRQDRLREEGLEERDGPFKLRCELCGLRSWLDYFRDTVTKAEDGPPE